MERKTHRDSWTGELSVKERFLLKESEVMAFLTGKFDMEKKLEKMLAQGKSEQEVQEIR